MLRCPRFVGVLVVAFIGFALLASPSLAGTAPQALTGEELQRHLQKFMQELPPEAKEYLAKSAAACPPGGTANVIFSTPANNNTVYTIEQCSTQCQLIAGNTVNGDQICLKIFNVPQNSTFDGNLIPTDGSDVKCELSGIISGTFCFRPDYTQTGPHTVLFVLTDKVTTCSQTRIVTFNVVCETEEPEVTCPPGLTIAANANCQAAVPDFTLGAVATDNCTPNNQLVLAQIPTAGTLLGVGKHDIVVTATDACGNVGRCLTSFTVADSTPPQITCPADISVDNDRRQCAAEVIFNVGVIDNCDQSPSAFCVPASGSVFPVGTSTVKCYGQDVSGNIDSCDFDVTVKDVEPPQLSCPPPGSIVVPTDPGRCDAAAQYGVGVSDNCDPAPLVVCTPASGSIFPLGVTPVKCIATDVYGNKDSCQFDVTVIDLESPVATCPANITVGSDPDTCGAIVAFTVTGTDNCDPNPTIQCFPPSGSFFTVGTTGVFCTVTDAAGNEGFCNFTVTVTNAAPTVSSNDTAVFICEPTSICRPVFSSDPDNNLKSVFCDGQPVAPGVGQFCFLADTAGTYTFTCIAVDACGVQSAPDFQFVVVTVNQPPILTRSGPNLLARPQQQQRKGVE